MKLDTSGKVCSCFNNLKMKQPLTHFLLLLFFMSCLCFCYAKKRTQKKTHVVKHNNRSWKIKTVEGGAKGTGNDYQEDELNGERLCSYFVSYKIVFVVN